MIVGPAIVDRRGHHVLVHDRGDPVAEVTFIGLDFDQDHAQSVGFVAIQNINIEFDIEWRRFNPRDLHARSPF